MAKCEVCSGDKVFMGKLGNLNHYRCRNCGKDSSVNLEDDLDLYGGYLDE